MLLFVRVKYWFHRCSNSPGITFLSEYFRPSFRTNENLLSTLKCRLTTALIALTNYAWVIYTLNIFSFFLPGELNEALDSIDKAILLDFRNPVSLVSLW